MIEKFSNFKLILNSVTTTIFPRPPLKTYYWVSFSIGLGIAFILCVFQPFGTEAFQHPNKFLILAGYGLVVGSVVALYFTLSKSVINKKIEHRWTIIREVIDLFCSVVLSILACYIYASLVIFGHISWTSLFGFSLSAASVALLPTLIYLAFLYMKWRDAVRSDIEEDHSKPIEQQLEITLKGVNKSDIIKAKIEDILYAEAQDNYVILGVFNENKLQRHIIRSTLSKVSEQLNPQVFKKVHRSYIVNTQIINEVSGNKSKATIQLSKIDKKIPLSRTYYDEIKTISARA